jgi:hypothetical protein
LVEDSGAPSTAHNTRGRFHGAPFRMSLEKQVLKDIAEGNF